MIECCSSLRRKTWPIVIVALAAIALNASNVSAQSPLGAAQNFAVLAGTAVTCTSSAITGDVGVVLSTGFAQTGCTIMGTLHLGGPGANQAYADFLAAHDVLADPGRFPCTGSLNTAYTDATLTLAPGVYCNNADVTFTRTTLTLDASGDRNAFWIFKIGTLGTGALTGTSLSVVMAGGGQACNVYWWLAQAGTVTTSFFKGNILAGADITSTDSAVIGDLLAGGAGQASLPTGAVTLTDSTASACQATGGHPGHGGHRGHGHHVHRKCNQGVGNGPEGCDPGNSNHHHGSNDEDGGTPGNPGRKQPAHKK